MSLFVTRPLSASIGQLGFKLEVIYCVGGVISPLLSNVYGHALDALFEKEASHLGKLVRFADDGVILCRSEADARAALDWLRSRAVALHLVLHPEKTRMIDLREGVDGFDFLGFHIRLVKSWRTKRWYCQRWPSGRALSAIRAKVKAITGPRSRLKWPIQEMVSVLNPVLRGWGQYFRVGNSTKKFSQIDTYVYERLALFDSKKRQQRGRRWHVHTLAWFRRLGVYRLSGSVRYVSFATGTT